jgi:hypothetical protein
MANTGLRVRIRIDGLREVLAAARRLPPEAKTLLKDRTKRISERLAAGIRSAAASDNRQTALMAPTVRARQGLAPNVAAGGSKRVGRNRVPAYKVLFGSEFGAKQYPQFRPHRGAASYWFFQTVERNQDEIGQEWREMADEIIDRWNA